MKTFGVLSVFLFSLFLIGSSFGGNADALTSISVDTEIRMDVEPIITVSFSTRAAILKASMKPGQLDEIKVGAEIRTNSRTGYKAYLSTDKRRKSATDKKATSLVHINNNTDTIPTLESSVAAGDFPVNHWGYSIDGGANYNGMRASNDIDLADFTTSNSSEMRNMDLYFATKIDSGQAGGFYENTIIVTAVANYVAQTINDIEYMQDINNEIALSMVEDQQYQLKDKRDEKKYWVSRLRDGNIWMTQNLDYRNIVDGKLVLTRELSDVWSDINYDIVSYMERPSTSTDYSISDSDNNTDDYRNLVYFEDKGFASGFGNVRVVNSTSEESNHYRLGTKYGDYVYRLHGIYKQEFNQYGHNSEPNSASAEFDEYVLNHPQSLCPKGWRYPNSDEYYYLPQYYGAKYYENWSSSDFASSAAYPVLVDSNYSSFGIVTNSSTNSSYEIYARYYYSDTTSNNKRYFRTSYSRWNGSFVRCVMRW